MDLQSLIKKLDEIASNQQLSEAAPIQFTPTHFHKNNFGGRTSLMLHNDGNFYHMKQIPYGVGSGPDAGKQVIAKWNFGLFDPEDRSAINPASIDGEFVDGKPVDYPEGVTWKTFKDGETDPGTMDTLPTDDQKKTSNYTGSDQKTPDPVPVQTIAEPIKQAAQTPPVDEITRDIEIATKLLDKAEGKSSSIKEDIFKSLVESFGYIVEALKDLSADEQKELKDAMIRLYPYKDNRADVKKLVDRYMVLIKADEPRKDPVPVKPSTDKPSEKETVPVKPSTDTPSEKETVLTPEELKATLAKFKALLDKLERSRKNKTSGSKTNSFVSKDIVKENKSDISSILVKLLEIENKDENKNRYDELLTKEEQIELGKLYLILAHPRYASNPDIVKELDRYKRVTKDIAITTSPDAPEEPKPAPAPRPDSVPTEPPTPDDPSLDDTLTEADKEIAADFRKSMRGPGTDERLFFKTLEKIQTAKQWKKIAKIYKQSYDEELIDAIKGDFSGSALRRIKNTLKTKFQVDMDKRPSRKDSANTTTTTTDTTKDNQKNKPKPEVESEKNAEIERKRKEQEKLIATLTSDEKKKIDFAFNNPEFFGVKDKIKEEYDKATKEKRRAVAAYCNLKGYDAKKTFGIDFSKDM